MPLKFPQLPAHCDMVELNALWDPVGGFLCASELRRLTSYRILQVVRRVSSESLECE